jgi:small membrane protein
MIFQPSQILFIAAIIGFLSYVFWIRTAGTDRLIYAALVFGGVLLVLFPALATRLANLVGIGRGADLVFYLFVIGSLFLSAHLLARLREAERSITRLVRRMAVEQAVREGSLSSPQEVPAADPGSAREAERA